MKTMLKTVALTALLASTACGNSDTGSKRSDTAQEKPAATLAFTGTLSEGLATNGRVHKLHSVYSVPAADAAETISVTLKLLDAQGVEVWSKTQPGAEADWSLSLTGAEGAYKLVGEASTLTSTTTHPAAPWTASFLLDATQPALAASASLGPVDATGERQLILKLVVSGETAASCEAPKVSLPGVATPLVVPFDGDGAAPALEFNVKGQVLKDVGVGNMTVAFKCTDAAKNPAELIEPVGFGSRKFSLAAKPRNKFGPVPGGTDLVGYLKPGQMTIDLLLLDATTAQTLTDAALAAETPLLRVYVTEAAPASLADLADGKPLLWTQPFDPALSFPLPSGVLGRKALYISATRRDPLTGTEELAGTVPLDLFVAGTAPQVTLRRMPLLAPAAKGRSLSVDVAVTTGEAPVDGDLVVQQSLDNVTWDQLPATSATRTEAGQRIDTLSFAYPLEKEAPYRVRVVAKDLAGYEVTSGMSASLVVPPEVALAVPADERAACAGSKLKFWLAAASTCKQNDVAGQAVGTAQATLVVQNRGSAAPTFFSTTEIAASLGYQVWVDGVRKHTARYDPPTAFAIAPAAGYLHLFELDPEWLKGKKVEILFDFDSADNNSTMNACYPVETPFAPALVKDVDAGLLLPESPFPCDESQVLAL